MPLNGQSDRERERETKKLFSWSVMVVAGLDQRLKETMRHAKHCRPTNKGSRLCHVRDWPLRKTGQFRTARPPSRPGRTIQPTRPGNAKHAAGRCCVSFEFFMELVPDHRHRSTPDRAGSNSPIGSGGSITFGDGIVC